jgi:hypothetical protein
MAAPPLFCCPILLFIAAAFQAIGTGCATIINSRHIHDLWDDDRADA